MRLMHEVPRNDAERKEAKAARRQDGRSSNFFSRNTKRLGLLLAGGVAAAGCAKVDGHVPAACIVQTGEGTRSLSAASAGMEIPLRGGKVLNVHSVDEAEGTVTVSVSTGPVRSEPTEINSGSVAEVGGVEVSVCGVSDGEASISTDPSPNPSMRAVRNKRTERIDFPTCREEEGNRQRATIVRGEVLIDGEWVEKVIAVRVELDEALSPAKYISKMCSIMLGERNLRIMEVHQNGNIELLSEVRQDGDLPKNSLLMVSTEQGPVYIRIMGSTDPELRGDSLITVTNEHGTELYQGFAPFKRRQITFTSPEGGGALAIGMVPSMGDEASMMVRVLAGTPAQLFVASIPYYRTPEGTYWITGINVDEHGSLMGIEMVLERVPFPEGFGGH